MADSSGPTQQASFTTTNDALTLSGIGYNSFSVQITGTWAGVNSFEASNDGTNWFSISGTPPTSATGVSSTTANGQWIFAIIYTQFRIRFSTATSGTAVVTVCRSQSTIDPAAASGTSGGAVTIGAGSALIGSVGIDQTTPGTTNAVAAAGRVAHDAVGTSIAPVLGGGYASAAAPADVSADGDSVRAWHLRNGSYVTNLAAGSTLILAGHGTAAGALRVELPTDGTGVVGLNAGSAIVGKFGIDQTTPGTTNQVYLTDINAGEYETVAASQTAQVLGATGAAGDYLAGVLIIPATTSPGNVIILDNATSITIFTGGSSSVSSLVPFFVPLGIKSVSGAWKVTTGANVSAIGCGNFT